MIASSHLIHTALLSNPDTSSRFASTAHEMIISACTSTLLFSATHATVSWHLTGNEIIGYRSGLAVCAQPRSDKACILIYSWLARSIVAKSPITNENSITFRRKVGLTGNPTQFVLFLSRFRSPVCILQIHEHFLVSEI